MATTETDGTDASCPLCDDYRGAPPSVEAHISRMTDPIHQGEVGQSHRDDLYRQVDEDRPDRQTDDVEEADGVDETATEELPHGDGPVPSQDTDGEDGDLEGEDMVSREEYEQQPSLEPSSESGDVDEDGGAESVAVEAVEETDDGEAFGVPVSDTALYAGLALFAVVVYWYASGQSGTSEPAPSPGTGQQDSQQSQSGTTLIEGD